MVHPSCARVGDLAAGQAGRAESEQAAHERERKSQKAKTIVYTFGSGQDRRGAGPVEH